MPTSNEPTFSLDSHDITEIIQNLQDNPDIDEDELLKVEWLYLPMLGKYNQGSPRTLEHRLSSHPENFCEVIQMVFRSEQESSSNAEPSDEHKAMAENAYRLLQEWQTPPGTVPEHEFSGGIFKEWIEAVKKSSEESGHLTVALHQAGGVLIHCPGDPDGLWIHRSVADVLNRQDMEEFRRGYSLAIFNSRRAHFVDPKGKPELELAHKYRMQAEEVENAGYHRIATMLRGVGDTYERDAKQIVSRCASQQDIEEAE